MNPRVVLLCMGDRSSALFVNRKRVMTERHGDPAHVGHGIAEGLGVALEIHHVSPPGRYWSWEGILDSLEVPAKDTTPTVLSCRQCGDVVADGYCAAPACLYNRWPQRVLPADLAGRSDAWIENKYGVVRRQENKEMNHA